MGALDWYQQQQVKDMRRQFATGGNYNHPHDDDLEINYNNLIEILNDPSEHPPQMNSFLDAIDYLYARYFRRGDTFFTVKIRNEGNDYFTRVVAHQLGFAFDQNAPAEEAPTIPQPSSAPQSSNSAAVVEIAAQSDPIEQNISINQVTNFVDYQKIQHLLSLYILKCLFDPEVNKNVKKILSLTANLPYSSVTDRQKAALHHLEEILERFEKHDLVETNKAVFHEIARIYSAQVNPEKFFPFFSSSTPLDISSVIFLAITTYLLSNPQFDIVFACALVGMFLLFWNNLNSLIDKKAITRRNFHHDLVNNSSHSEMSCFIFLPALSLILMAASGALRKKEVGGETNTWDQLFNLTIIVSALTFTGAKLIINRSMSINYFRKTNKETVKLAEEMLEKNHRFDQAFFDETPPIDPKYRAQPLVTRDANFQQDPEQPSTHVLLYENAAWQLYRFENNSNPVLMDTNSVNDLSKFLAEEDIDEQGEFSGSTQVLAQILTEHEKAISDAPHSEKEEYIHQCSKLLKLIVEKEKQFIFYAENTIFKIQRKLNATIMKMHEKQPVCSVQQMEFIFAFLNNNDQELQRDKTHLYQQQEVQQIFLEARIEYSDDQLQNFTHISNRINAAIREISENHAELFLENYKFIKEWQNQYQKIEGFFKQLKDNFPLKPILDNISIAYKQYCESNNYLNVALKMINGLADKKIQIAFIKFVEKEIQETLVKNKNQLEAIPGLQQDIAGRREIVKSVEEVFQKLNSPNIEQNINELETAIAQAKTNQQTTNSPTSGM